MTTKQQKTIGWFLHKDHGFMYRGSVDELGYQPVVAALCLHTTEIQYDEGSWRQHKNRLHVNAGCGAVCLELMREGDHNPAFERIHYSPPRHIWLDYLSVLNGV
jgi:hypothetical protein